jgi:hypothetical protein
MRNWGVAYLGGVGIVLVAKSELAAEQTQVEPTQVEKVQAALDISFGDTGPLIGAFAGEVGRDRDSQPVAEG